MFCVAVTYLIRRGQEKNAVEIFNALTTLTQLEVGNIMYIAHRSIEDPQRFFLYECYQNKEAFDAHCSSEYFKQYVVHGLHTIYESHHSELYEAWSR